MRLIIVLAVMLVVSLTRPVLADGSVAEVQRLLVRAGYAAGQADGIMGTQTREALSRYQRHKGLEDDSVVSEAILALLRGERPAPALAPASRVAAGTRLNLPQVNSELLALAGGCFTMGSPQSEVGRFEDEERAHRVCVSPFAIATHEVTVGEYRRFVDATGFVTDAENDVEERGCYGTVYEASSSKAEWVAGRSWRDPGFSQSDRHPVVCVSHRDVTAYLKWLRRETGRPLRLLTEAEWEFAVRAGSGAARFWGEDPSRACLFANVGDQTKGGPGGTWSKQKAHDCTDGYYETAPVGGFAANGNNLFDMLGNVWEWTCSVYDQDYSGAETLCAAPTSDARRVARGGSWDDEPRRVRSANRNGGDPRNRDGKVRFRLAQDLN